MKKENFQVFVDEDIQDTPLEYDRKFCKSRCGRFVRAGLNQILRSHDYCCRNCSLSKGADHNSYCGAPVHPQAPQTESIESLPIQSLTSRIDSLISVLPETGATLDLTSANQIFDVLCLSNGIPTLDAKWFTILFSRFAKDGCIPAAEVRKFFYVGLRKISRMLDEGVTRFHVPRHFFVVRNSNIRKHYRFKSVLGQGAFGIVHRVVQICSGHTRVCKSIFKKSTSIPLQQIESEIRVIAKLDHPGIIRIYEFFEDDEHYHLIMEFCSNGDLMRLIKESIKLKSPIPLDNVRAILQQLLKAVSFMNSNKVIHKDLKPENVMLVESGPSNVFPVVKVIDFGLSELFRTEQDASTTVAGTAFYMAPEIFKPPFSFKCDVWSVGVIAFFMITGYLPFFGATVSEVKSNVLYRKLQWPSTFAGTERAVDVPDNLRELVDRLLEKDPLFRPTATEALGDRWFLVEPGRTAKCARFSSHLAMNITRFSRLSPFKRAVLNLIAHMWTFEMALDIQFVFYELDKTNRGFLSIQLVAQSLEQVGISPLNALRAATSLDIAGDGAITYTSLTAALILPLLDSNKKILRCAFKCFNPTADNFITAVDAWKLMGGSRSVPADSRSEPNSFDAFRSSFEDEFRNICGIVSPHPNLTVSFNDFKKWLLSPN